ncbi:FUSC family protein [Aldersonia kunmingensis]|uniref:FUSC family protein n=1 Tax=Aldersonia kunmingensis TaxID=408066 RepID=UPI00082CACBF|nr:FUSC family protein [Aldersonia kunmingensis]
MLGTLSVMRSTALSTGSNVLRAVGGTVVGFIVGAALIGALGTGPVALWILMPFAVFLASFVPEMVSFAAGQTAFTVVVLIAFNLIAPQGYKVGIVRIEDVALGCAVAVVVSILLWPRSVAKTTIRAANESTSQSAHYLLAAVHRVTRHADIPDDAVRDAIAATRTADDAVRQYLGESGGDADLQEVLQTSRRANRVLLAAEAIARIPLRTPADSATTARSVVDAHAAAIVAWLDDADGTSHAGAPSIGTDLSDALATDGLDTARDLLWAAVYLNELELLGQEMQSA